MKEKRQILLTKKVNVGFRKTESHHQKALDSDDIMPKMHAPGAQEIEGRPGVEYGREHGGDDDAGSQPTDTLPTAPLLDGAGIAEHQQTRNDSEKKGMLQLKNLAIHLNEKNKMVTF